jgi:hypothetical protein
MATNYWLLTAKVLSLAVLKRPPVVPVDRCAATTMHLKPTVLLARRSTARNYPGVAHLRAKPPKLRRTMDLHA